MIIISDQDIRTIMDGVVDKFLIPSFNSHEQNASGEWLATVETSAFNNVGTIRGRDYSEYLQRGRGPNRDQSPEAIRKWAYWYGMNVIAPWAKNKGISINPIGAAYNIAKKGTRSLKKGGTKFLDILESQECLDYIRKELTTLIVVQAKGEIEQFDYGS